MASVSGATARARPGPVAPPCRWRHSVGSGSRLLDLLGGGPRLGHAEEGLLEPDRHAGVEAPADRSGHDVEPAILVELVHLLLAQHRLPLTTRPVGRPKVPGERSVTPEHPAPDLGLEVGTPVDDPPGRNDVSSRGLPLSLVTPLCIHRQSPR